MSDTQEPSVLARRDGRVGRLILNRPKALNALDLTMIRLIEQALVEWRDDPSVHAVVIEGSGGKAFCAGGDIRGLRDDAVAGNAEGIHRFFSEEYRLNLMIAHYPKPYIALIDGICMGGGIGISVHAPYRVASEAAMFAMPETAIGFFPDVGATYFLPRLPGHLGMYLGLSGARVQGADAVHVGLATHFVPREKIAELSAALAAEGVACMARFTAPMPAFTLAGEMAAIERCFDAPDVASIFARLEAEPGEWAAKTLATMRAMSPSAVIWSHKAINDGAGQTLAEALQEELALSAKVAKHPDFPEGVRSVVIDKDRNAKWQPATLEEALKTPLV